MHPEVPRPDITNGPDEAPPSHRTKFQIFSCRQRPFTHHLALDASHSTRWTAPAQQVVVRYGPTGWAIIYSLAFRVKSWECVFGSLAWHTAKYTLLPGTITFHRLWGLMCSECQLLVILWVCVERFGPSLSLSQSMVKQIYRTQGKYAPVNSLGLWCYLLWSFVH